MSEYEPSPDDSYSGEMSAEERKRAFQSLGTIECPICSEEVFDLEEHIQENHPETYHKLIGDAEKLTKISEESKEVTESIRDRLLREELERLAEEDPARFEYVRIRPKELDKLLERRMWELALKMPMAKEPLLPYASHELSKKETSEYLEFPKEWSKYPKPIANKCPQNHYAVAIDGEYHCVPANKVEAYEVRRIIEKKSYPKGYKPYYYAEEGEILPMPKNAPIPKDVPVVRERPTSRGFVRTSQESLSEEDREKEKYLVILKALTRKSKQD